MSEEYLDLYDAEGKRTGRKILRSEKHLMEENDNILVVHLCIFDRSRRMLLQKRSMQKKGWAGLWDVSAGGHVMAGESGEEAVRREAKEELGVSWYGYMHLISRFTIPHVLDDFYGVTAELDPEKLTLQQGEVDTVAWVSREEALALWRDEQMVPYDAGVIEALYDQYPE